MSRRAKRYLEILQATMKEVSHNQVQRGLLVLKNQLSDKNIVQAINTQTMPIIRYPDGIITCLKEAIEDTNIKTQKLLIIREGF